jgi:RNA polymerase sigma-70 factor (ECF subfamily)
MSTLAPSIPTPVRRVPTAMPPEDRSAPADRRLIQGLRARDGEALRELHASYGRTVLGFLIRTLRDRAAAEDVFQQVFLELWQRGPTYDPGRGSLLTWIMTIARSRAIDHLRARIPEPHDPSSSLALHDSREVAPEVDALVEQWHFAHLLSRLPPQEADLLRRRFYAGESQRTIAEATGIPLGTVKMRMVQALARLREMIDDEERGG